MIRLIGVKVRSSAPSRAGAADRRCRHARHRRRAPRPRHPLFENVTAFKPAELHLAQPTTLFDQVVAWRAAMKTLRQELATAA